MSYPTDEMVEAAARVLTAAAVNDRRLDFESVAKEVARAALLAAERAAWRPIDPKSPPSGSVMIWRKSYKRAFIAMHVGGVWEATHDGPQFYTPTHWRPLPAPPITPP